MNPNEIRGALRNGYFAINKPKAVTSVEVLETLKRILQKDFPKNCRPNEIRLGHGGTLDHSATGVLVVGVGWGCKILPLLLHGDKEYKVSGRFGTATDTYNEVGNITQEKKYDHITKLMFKEALKNYVGRIHQKPPKYSALKLHGKRIADWIREGKDIEMTPRPVVCYRIHCTEFCLPDFKLELSCGGGFYVRSLVHDVGQDLQSCAYVTSLHRIKHGPFTEEDSLDESHWQGNEIVEAIVKAREKYGNLLKKSKAITAKTNNYKSSQIDRIL